MNTYPFLSGSLALTGCAPRHFSYPFQGGDRDNPCTAQFGAGATSLSTPSSIQTESSLTALSITCTVCRSPQPIETVPATEPFHQIFCQACGANLLVVNPQPQYPSDTARPSESDDDSDPAPSERLRARGTRAGIALFLVNLILVSFALHYAYESFKTWYDPWDLREHPYAPVLLTALGWAPLHLAAAQGDETLVKTLLANGADVLATNSRGNTPLHESAKRGHVAVVSQLLAHKSPVDLRGHDGMTALHMAASHEHTDVAKLLIAHGAQVNLTATDRKVTALHIAADEGDAETVADLLGARAEVNARNKSKETPLHVVAWRSWQDDADVATLLLDHGADLDARDDLGFAPLNRAARQGNHHVAKLLVARGVDLEAKTLKGSTALYQAAWAGDLKTVRLLLDRGANPNARNMEGFTPLMTAARRAHSEVVRLLLERGADVNLRANGKTALEYALECNCRESTVPILQEHGGQVYAELRRHIVQGGELSKQHQYTQALVEQSQAIALAPADADLYYHRALTHLCLSAFAAARQDLQKAIELDPTSFEASHQMTYVLAQQQQWEESTRYWDRLIALMPKHAQARYERGFVTLNREGRTGSDLARALDDLSLSCQYGYQEACTVHEQTLRRQSK